MNVDIYTDLLERAYSQQKVMIEMLRKQLQEQNKLREHAEEELRIVIRNAKKRVKK